MNDGEEASSDEYEDYEDEVWILAGPSEAKTEDGTVVQKAPGKEVDKAPVPVLDVEDLEMEPEEAAAAPKVALQETLSKEEILEQVKSMFPDALELYIEECVGMTKQVLKAIL